MFPFMSEYKGDETTGFQSPAQDYIEGVVDQIEDKPTSGFRPAKSSSRTTWVPCC